MNKYYKKKAYQKLGVTIARGAQRGSKELEISRGRKQATRRKSPKPSTAEKFHEANTLEDRVEIGREVTELRINATGSKGMAWRKIRERLGLRNNEFHNGIRLEDHFKESVVERIESFKSGWECQVDLTVLCGFKPTGEWLDRIEACRP